MTYYVGLDASKHYTNVCVVDSHGSIVTEQRLETSPSIIARLLKSQRRRYAKVGVEASSISRYLYEGLAREGVPIVCIDARHAHLILKAQANKTDRLDARGIAHLMRTGMYRTAHVKTRESQHIGSMLTARKLLQSKFIDIENAIRGLLLTDGIKIDGGRRVTFEARVRHAISSDPSMQTVIEPLLVVNSHILTGIRCLEQELQTIADADPICRLLATAPGVGWLTALTFRCQVDVARRFPRSRSVGPHLGLVPRTFQSGEIEWRGRIGQRRGDPLRAALFCSALIILRKNTRTSWLKVWGEGVANRRGKKRAAIAVARRLAVTLHHMWITNQSFRWEAAS